METFKASKKIIIHGDFSGKYHGNEIIGKSSYTEYDIKIVEGKVEDATKKEFIEFISNKSISYKANKILNVKVQIKDDNYDSKYIFVEDLIDVTIYDIQFINVIKEQNKTFGEIRGKIFGSLEYHEDVEIIKPKIEKPKKTSQILKNVAKKVKRKTEKNFFPSLSIVFYIFLFSSLAILLKENFLILLLFAAGLYILRSIFFLIIKFLFRSSYLIFILLIFLGIGFLFYEGLNSSNNINYENLDKDPTEYSEIVFRPLTWYDYDNRKYSSEFKFLYGDYIKSKNHKNKLTPYSETNLYSSLNSFNKNMLGLIYKSLQKIKIENKLNAKKFAEVVVSLVQSIPYSFNIEGDCNGYNLPDDYSDAILSGVPCLSFIKHDILSPLEFFYLKTGDCDSRTVLIYTILKNFGYDVVILNSNLYMHSMIGINLPSYGKYKLINGKKYFFWETTADGWELGILPPENWDINKWYLALK